MYRIQHLDREDTFNNNDALKQPLIDYIYSTIDMSRFRYELLEFESELYQFVEKKYFVSANFSGSNCLLVFGKIKDKYCSFLVDRKTLKYSSQKININDVKITHVKLKMDLEIYKGSIFDGIFIQNKTSKTFIITDVYMFRGQDCTKTNIKSKLLTILTYLKSNYNEHDKDNTLNIAVNKLYELHELESLIKNTIPKMKEFLVRGVCFYPETSGVKRIFMFDNHERKKNNIIEPIGFSRNQDRNLDRNLDRNQDRNQDRYQDINNSKSPQDIFVSKTKSSSSDSGMIQEVKKNVKLIYAPKKHVNDESYVFEMKKTEITDAYILNAVEPVVKDNKNCYKRKKVCLALIPDANKTKWCNDILKNGDTVLVHCKYHASKMKWEPISVSTAKRPSCLSEFDIKELED